MAMSNLSAGCTTVHGASDVLERVHERTEARFRFVSDAAFGKDQRIQKFELSNGLMLLALVDERSPVFAYHSWYRVGSRHEQPGKTGMAHLFEHMMFKATRSLGDGEFDKLMERRGAQTNAATWVDWTYYHEALPSVGDNLETVVRTEADRMVNLLVNEVQLTSEREVVMNERRYRVDDDPDGKMYEELYRLALPDHPYGWPTIGWMADIEGLSVEDCLAFYRAYYAPNNVVLVVVGGFDLTELLVHVGNHYGSLERQDLPPESPVPQVIHREPRRKQLQLPVSQERLLMGYVGPAINDADMAAVDVALEILFSGESSRVYRVLVTEQERASHVSGWVSHFRYPGLIEIAASAKSGHSAAELEAVVLEQLARLAAEPPSDRELEKARNLLEIGVYRSSYSADGLANRLGHYEVTAGDFQAFSESVQKIQEVTAGDVQRVMQHYFRPESRSVIVAQP